MNKQQMMIVGVVVVLAGAMVAFGFGGCPWGLRCLVPEAPIN